MANFRRRRLLEIAVPVSAVSLFSKLFPVRNARAATGGTSWKVAGNFLYACPCAAACPCDFNSPPTAGYCTVVVGWHIDSGRFGDVALDGLNAARMLHSPGDMADGHFKVAFYLDERANDAQREALKAIFSIKAGGAFAGMAKAVDEDLGVRFVPITVETSGRRRKMSIGTIADADVTAVAGRDGNEVVIDNLADYDGPLTIGKSSQTRYSDHNIHLEVSGKTGTFARFVLSSA
jgi:hypothetical protein